MMNAMDKVIRPGPSHRAVYRDFFPIITRWADNDAFGHVNNATYYTYYDSAVTGWLLQRGLLAFSGGRMWMVAETGCRFYSEVLFPQTLAVGMRVARLGSTSVRWDLALFREDSDIASSEGLMVHVHVDRVTRRPTPIPADLRTLFDPVLA
jgi:acyl-CoA thioester hydrolase